MHNRKNPEDIVCSIMKVIVNKQFDIDKLYIMRYELHRNENGTYVQPTDRRARNNNLIVQTSFAVLTNECVLEKQFTPGNFDELKKIGYSIQATRQETEFNNKAKDRNTLSNQAQRYDSWMSYSSIKAIKSASYKSKNLIDFNTQVDFHKQNMVAAKLIGIFAQANVSHSLCSMLDCELNIPQQYAFKLEEPIGNKHGSEVHEIQGIVPIDRVYGFNGKRTSDSFASCLAASVDAVKDPIMNLMNINTDTANVVTTLLRLGFSIETCALICSQKCIIDALNAYNRENAQKDYKQNLSQFLSKRIRSIGVEVGKLSNITFNYKFLKNNMIETQSQADEVAILKLFNALLGISESFQNITHMTRYNSIASAVGPTSFDTIEQLIQDNEFELNDTITDQTKDQIRQHPVLKAFMESSHELEAKLLGLNLIQSSNYMRTTFERYGDIIGRYNFKKFGDFVMSYIMLLNTQTLKPVFDMSDERVNYLLNQFSVDAMALKALHPENAFLQAIQITRDFKSGATILNINKKAVDAEEVSSGWIDLFKEDEQVAINFVQYAYLMGSFAFSPKTFMNYLPTIIKQRLPHYVDNLKVTNHTLDIYTNRMIDQFLALNKLSVNKIPIDLNDETNPLQLNNDGTYTLFNSNILPGVSKARLNKTTIWVYLKEDSPGVFNLRQIFPDDPKNSSWFNVDPHNDLPSSMYTTGNPKLTIQYILTQQNERDNDLTQNQVDRNTAEQVFTNAFTYTTMNMDEITSVLGNNPSEKQINTFLNKSNQNVLTARDFENIHIKQMFQLFMKLAGKNNMINNLSQNDLMKLVRLTQEEYKKTCL